MTLNKTRLSLSGARRLPTACGWPTQLNLISRINAYLRRRTLEAWTTCHVGIQPIVIEQHHRESVIPGNQKIGSPSALCGVMNGSLVLARWRAHATHAILDRKTGKLIRTLLSFSATSLLTCSLHSIRIPPQNQSGCLRATSSNSSTKIYAYDTYILRLRPFTFFFNASICLI